MPLIGGRSLKLAPDQAGPIPMLDGASCGALGNLVIAAFVLVVIPLIARCSRGFPANVSMLIGSVAGGVLAVGLGRSGFDKVARHRDSIWSRRSPSACRPSTRWWS